MRICGRLGRPQTVAGPQSSEVPVPKSKSAEPVNTFAITLECSCPNCGMLHDVVTTPDEAEVLKAGRLAPPYAVLCELHR